jgi:hypothetical protein
MGTGLAELKAAVATQNIVVTGPWFTHHVRNPSKIFDFEICLPVATPVAPAGRMRPGQWPLSISNQPDATVGALQEPTKGELSCPVSLVNGMRAKR